MANFIFCAVSVNNSIFLRKQQEMKFLMKIISLMTPPHTWPAGNYVIVRDSSITGIDKKNFSKNCLVKVHDFRGATVADINHYIIPI